MAATGRPQMSVTAIIERILKRASARAGATRNDLTSGLFDENRRLEVRRIIDSLVVEGTLHRFTRPSSGAPAQRFFTHKHHGEHWCGTAIVSRKAPAPKADNFATLTPQANQARTRAVAPPKTVTVIVPAHVKVTVGPCHPVDARYQCEPGARVVGCGFAALKPGQYIAEAHGLAARAVE